jgi:hypothetical protein
MNPSQEVLRSSEIVVDGLIDVLIIIISDNSLLSMNPSREVEII